MQTRQPPENIDGYIAGFPTDVQEILEKIRAAIQNVAPEAQETISYKMPTFNLNGQYLIYFAAFKKHIRLYPVPQGDAKFNEEISTFQSGKGTLQLPLNKQIPYKLIRKFVKLRVKENLAKATMKEKR